MSGDQRTISVRSAFASMAGGYVSMSRHDSVAMPVLRAAASNTAARLGNGTPAPSALMTR